MNVLSLFDGISCGRLALERVNLPAERYDAFEIDKYAIAISKNNFPDIVQRGNVLDGDFKKFKGYDLLLGGSPCTYWSVAKKNRETSPMARASGFSENIFVLWKNQSADIFFMKTTIPFTRI